MTGKHQVHYCGSMECVRFQLLRASTSVFDPSIYSGLRKEHLMVCGS